MTTVCFGVLVVSSCFSYAVAEQTPAAVRRPNFIIIFCDNLGYGDIEPFGSQVHRTPCLNRMAREGMKFTHFCVTAGVCTPSRASLMTGCYAQRVAMHKNDRDGHVLRPVSPYGLHPDEVTMAEVLKPQGYATAIIGKWHLGDQPMFLPLQQGFDSFFGIPYSDDMTRDVGQRLGDRLDGKRWPPLPLMEDDQVICAPADRNLLTQLYTERALQYIEANRDRPFFLYLAHAMPGSTKVPFASESFRGKSANGPWGDAVEELDWSTGQVLDKLVELGIGERTLVVWTSDNGAPMTGKPKDLSRGTNLPLPGRGYTTAEGAFRVPTLCWWPGEIPPASTCGELASTLDLLPTFAYLAGTKPPQDRIIDGKDIRPLLYGQPDARSPHDVFNYYYCDQLQAVRSGPWKLFVPMEAPQRHPHHRGNDPSPAMLFNVVDDVGCRHDVASQQPDIVKQLLSLAAIARADLGDLDTPGSGQRPIGHCPHPTPRTRK